METHLDVSKHLAPIHQVSAPVDLFSCMLVLVCLVFYGEDDQSRGSSDRLLERTWAIVVVYVLELGSRTQSPYVSTSAEWAPCLLRSLYVSCKVGDRTLSSGAIYRAAMLCMTMANIVAILF
jgi:hypothetical protein